MNGQAETERKSIGPEIIEQLYEARNILADIDDQALPETVNVWLEDVLDAVYEIDEVYGDE